MNTYRSDLASLRRTVLGADPGNVLEVFRLICREGIRIHTVGGTEKADVVDALREIGLDANLDEDSIQVALGEAVDRPFDPTTAKKTERPLNGTTVPARTSASLVTRRASDIEPEPIRWLWPERIAIGKLTACR